jgi:hypothetical protein
LGYGTLAYDRVSGIIMQSCTEEDGFRKHIAFRRDLLIACRVDTVQCDFVIVQGWGNTTITEIPVEALEELVKEYVYKSLISEVIMSIKLVYLVSDVVWFRPELVCCNECFSGTDGSQISLPNGRILGEQKALEAVPL